VFTEYSQDDEGLLFDVDSLTSVAVVAVSSFTAVFDNTDAASFYSDTTISKT